MKKIEFKTILFYLYGGSLYVYKNWLILVFGEFYCLIRLPQFISKLSQLFFYTKLEILEVKLIDFSKFPSINVQIQRRFTKVLVDFYEQLNHLLYSLIVKYRKVVEVKGLGYRVIYDNRLGIIKLYLGHSVPSYYKVSNFIEIKCSSNKTLQSLSGDKQLLGNFVKTLQGLKTPNRYKEQGIYIEGEDVRLKIRVKS